MTYIPTPKYTGSGGSYNVLCLDDLLPVTGEKYSDVWSVENYVCQGDQQPRHILSLVILAKPATEYAGSFPYVFSDNIGDDESFIFSITRFPGGTSNIAVHGNVNLVE